MLSLYEILKASKTGIAPDMWTALAGANFGSSLSPTIHEYTGAVPYTFTANGSPLISWRISGNTVQNGTPTPENPIMPQGCGDLETVGLNAGQYKIPILSANTTTPVYLGEMETVRKIKKLVLDGTETTSAAGGALRFNVDGYLRKEKIICVCSHYQGVKNVPSATNLQDDTVTFLVSSSGANYMYLRDARFINSPADFKTYLAAQYTAGTPVTVWYVLANETTGIVNEPLRKIGNYADEVSNVATIPTNNGSTTIDVDTTVKPSEVYIKYKGV